MYKSNLKTLQVHNNAWQAYAITVPADYMRPSIHTPKILITQQNNSWSNFW